MPRFCSIEGCSNIHKGGEGTALSIAKAVCMDSGALSEAHMKTLYKKFSGVVWELSKSAKKGVDRLYTDFQHRSLLCGKKRSEKYSVIC